MFTFINTEHFLIEKSIFIEYFIVLTETFRT